MKKITALLLLVVMCLGALSLTACSSGSKVDISPRFLSKDYNEEEYIKLPDIDAIAAEYSKDKALMNLKHRVTQYVADDIKSAEGRFNETTTGTVNEGDLVEITFLGTMKDGSQPDSMKTRDGEPSMLVLGSGSMIPGFEEGIYGATIGETKKVNVVFPAVYPNNPDLQNAPVTFDITVVKKLESVIDEEFLKKKEKASVDEYMKSAEETMKKILLQNAKNGLANNLISDTEFIKVPEGEAELEKKDELNRLNFSAKISGMTVDEVLKAQNTTLEEYEKQIDANTETVIKFKLLVSSLAKKYKVSVTNEEIRKYTESVFEEYEITDEKTLKERLNGCTFDEYANMYNLGLNLLVDNILSTMVGEDVK